MRRNSQPASGAFDGSDAGKTGSTVYRDCFPLRSSSSSFCQIGLARLSKPQYAGDRYQPPVLHPPP